MQSSCQEWTKHLLRFWRYSMILQGELLHLLRSFLYRDAAIAYYMINIFQLECGKPPCHKEHTCGIFGFPEPSSAAWNTQGSKDEENKCQAPEVHRVGKGCFNTRWMLLGCFLYPTWIAPPHHCFCQLWLSVFELECNTRHLRKYTLEEENMMDSWQSYCFGYR